MPDFSQFPLGKHLGVVEDPRTLMAARYFARSAALPPVPKSVTVTSKVPAFPMLANDRFGCCTCASSGHRVIADSVRAGQPVAVTDDDVLALYNRVNGGRDEGAYMLDVANALRTEGLGGHRIAAFARADVSRWDQVKLGMKLFGGIWLGVALPVSAQRQKRWDVGGAVKSRPRTDGDYKPGSWGGHAIWAGWATDSSMTCVTWGQKQPMARAFVELYCDEAYFLIDPVWFGSDQRSPQGFDLAALQADLAEVTR